MHLSKVLNRSASLSLKARPYILICLPEIKEIYSSINELNLKKSPTLVLSFISFFSSLASQYNGKHDQEVLNEDKYQRYDKFKILDLFSRRWHPAFCCYHNPLVVHRKCKKCRALSYPYVPRLTNFLSLLRNNWQLYDVVIFKVYSVMIWYAYTL